MGAQRLGLIGLILCKETLTREMMRAVSQDLNGQWALLL